MPLSMTHDLIDLYMFVITSMTFPVIPYENNFFQNVALLIQSNALLYSPVNIQMVPPQIATEGFSSDSLSKRSPEQHRIEKNLDGRTSFFRQNPKWQSKT